MTLFDSLNKPEAHWFSAFPDTFFLEKKKAQAKMMKAKKEDPTLEYKITKVIPPHGGIQYRVDYKSYRLPIIQINSKIYLLNNEADIEIFNGGIFCVQEKSYTVFSIKPNDKYYSLSDMSVSFYYHESFYTGVISDPEPIVRIIKAEIAEKESRLYASRMISAGLLRTMADNDEEVEGILCNPKL